MSASLPGARNPNARFTVAQVREIRALWRRGKLSAAQLSDRYKCSKKTIFSLVRGETYASPRYSRAAMCDRFTKKGERHPQHKLTEAQVIDIKRLLRLGELTKTAIGEMFGVSRSHIGLIGKGKYWRHVSP